MWNSVIFMEQESVFFLNGFSNVFLIKFCFLFNFFLISTFGLGWLFLFVFLTFYFQTYFQAIVCFSSYCSELGFELMTKVKILSVFYTFILKYWSKIRHHILGCLRNWILINLTKWWISDSEKMAQYLEEERHMREENLRLQRKLQREMERREALCRQLSESESSLEMDDERFVFFWPSRCVALIFQYLYYFLNIIE